MQRYLAFLFLHICVSLAGCADFPTCSECTAVNECVWCERNPTVGCLHGNMFGPDDSEYTCLSGDWRWNQCDTQGLYVISLGIGLSFVISCISLCTCFFCCKGLFRRQAAVTFDGYENDASSENYQMSQYSDWNPEEVQRLFAASHPSSPSFGTTYSYNKGPTAEEIRQAGLYEKFGV